MAELVHQFGGYCFVDFSASAPYVKIDMHPQNEAQHLDAIFFSPHKFLGGPGASGVIVFNKELYKNKVPDHPGGGTVTWTNPWGEQHYFNEIEIGEDGGTPGFLQGIKASLAILLKEEMGIEAMEEQEQNIKLRLLEGLRQIPGIHIFEDKKIPRLGYISFFTEKVHHNLIVRLLNDRFGIQTRGGCSCAGTYGHFLFNIDHEKSKHFTELIDRGDLSEKPGWVRISLHPVMTVAEIDYILNALEEIINNAEVWGEEYTFDKHSGDFEPHRDKFTLSLKQGFKALPI